MKNGKNVLALLTALLIPTFAYAQTNTNGAGAPVAQDYKATVKKLTRSEIDSLLAKPDKVVFIELRRPDQITADGSFPVYLNILSKDLEKNLAYIPKDRIIVTVGLHTNLSAKAGDLLLSKGFNVAGSVSTEEYIAQGGTITKILPPPPRPDATSQPETAK